MSRPITPRNYQAVDLDAQLVTWSDPAPAATAALVVQADSWPVVAAVTPYAGCGHVFDSSSEAGLYDRYLGIVVAPGAVHARAALSIRYAAYLAATSVTYHELWSTDGGVSGNDVIRVPGAALGDLSTLVEHYFQSGLDALTVTSPSSIDSPTYNVDRLIELQTVGVPYVEACYVNCVAGLSLCVVEQVTDLETL